MSEAARHGAHLPGHKAGPLRRGATGHRTPLCVGCGIVGYRPVPAAHEIGRTAPNGGRIAAGAAVAFGPGRCSPPGKHAARSWLRGRRRAPASVLTLRGFLVTRLRTSKAASSATRRTGSGTVHRKHVPLCAGPDQRATRPRPDNPSVWLRTWVGRRHAGRRLLRRHVLHTVQDA